MEKETSVHILCECLVQGCQVIMRKIRFSKYFYGIISFQIVLTFLSQISNSQNTKLYTTPQKEHAYTSKLALHSCDDSQLRVKTAFCINTYMGSSTETVAFQVYEILKINHEFLQFF